jgi:hypothetical protein
MYFYNVLYLYLYYYYYHHYYYYDGIYLSFYTGIFFMIHKFLLFSVLL